MGSKGAITKDVLASILDDKLKPIISTMDGLKESVHFMSEKFDTITMKINDLDKKYSAVELENKHLKVEVLRLANIVEHQSVEINDIEQYSRRDCLEIAGVPETEQENTNELVKKIGNLIGENLNDSDISVSHRLPKPSYSSRTSEGISGYSTNYSKIIVKFVGRDTKERFYKARKYLKDKSTRDIGISTVTENKIFISESLTSKNRELFKECLKFKRDHDFRFIWTRSGRLFLRKDTNSPIHAISNKTDLQALLPR
ncbi:uncharacterized protein LOC114533395 [Dendronephthya gigantea]|uniref:uncharacterized protein LOC114533395 n=1 Tax=Dendronephthya gigantea TaxID=151771 RepID=UPI001069B250|nr:uncharacterized protein LOC114533395 [Dendronephthya gigantea]